MSGNPNPVDNRGGPYATTCPVCWESVPQLPGHIEEELDRLEREGEIYLVGSGETAEVRRP